MRRSSLPLCVLFTAFVAGCGDGQSSSGCATTIDVNRAQPGEVLCVDDYPLYYMHITSDYGFDEYLRSGIGAARLVPQAHASSHSRWFACTCFSTAPASEGPFFGRNFDWWHRASLLLYASPPNALASMSMVDLHYLEFSDGVGLDALRSQRDHIERRAPYFPFDGVNQRGVAMGLMAVPSAQPPMDPAKVTLYDLALIRLVLDHATDTDHAVELLCGYNYGMTEPPVHFLIADPTGKAAVVEYVGGELKVTHSVEPFMVATNFVLFGSRAPLFTGCARYDRAYSTLAQRKGVLSRAEALDLLSAVSQDITMWSAVYDLAGRSVDVAPGRRYGKAYRFAMNAVR